jgi:predicted nucleotidyltransferase
MKTITSIGIADNERHAVEAASKMLKENFPVKKTVLFGSKVRGDDDEESDIDLLVLLERKITWEERKAIIGALFDIELSYDVVLSPLMVEEQEWHEGTFSIMPIYNEISRDGVLT